MDEFSPMNFETYQIRFTPKGKVCVLDIIKLLCKTKQPFSIWERLITDHPEILADCEDYPFQQEESLPVMYGRGLKQVLGFLPYYRQSQGLV
jgi:hypothetical protein